MIIWDRTNELIIKERIRVWNSLTENRNQIFKRNGSHQGRGIENIALMSQLTFIKILN